MFHEQSMLLPSYHQHFLFLIGNELNAVFIFLCGSSTEIVVFFLGFPKL